MRYRMPIRQTKKSLKWCFWHYISNASERVNDSPAKQHCPYVTSLIPYNKPGEELRVSNLGWAPPLSWMAYLESYAYSIQVSYPKPNRGNRAKPKLLDSRALLPPPNCISDVLRQSWTHWPQIIHWLGRKEETVNACPLMYKRYRKKWVICLTMWH